MPPHGHTCSSDTLQWSYSCSATCASHWTVCLRPPIPYRVTLRRWKVVADSHHRAGRGPSMADCHLLFPRPPTAREAPWFPPCWGPGDRGDRLASWLWLYQHHAGAEHILSRVPPHRTLDLIPSPFPPPSAPPKSSALPVPPAQGHICHLAPFQVPLPPLHFTQAPTSHGQLSTGYQAAPAIHSLYLMLSDEP